MGDVTRQTVYLRSMCRVKYAVFSNSQLLKLTIMLGLPWMKAESSSKT